jgi:GNAT superfamily N-acetyltransferase
MRKSRVASDMIDQVRINHLHTLPLELEPLRTEAVRQGFGFIDRLMSDWVRGANTFSGPGECLLGAFADTRLVGVGGLNADPYLPHIGVGRVRHVYILGEWRQKGIGRMLVGHLLDEARRSFGEVRLRTDTDAAASFYARCGFTPVKDATASHSLKFAQRRGP